MRSIGCQGLVGLGNCLHAVLARNLSLLFLCHFFAIPRALDVRYDILYELNFFLVLSKMSTGNIDEDTVDFYNLSGFLFTLTKQNF